MKLRSSVDLAHPLRRAFAGLALFLSCAATQRTEAATNVNWNGGRVMINPITVYVVYWIPPGVVLDPTVAGGVGNFVSLTENFFTGVSGTPYFNILTQYPEKYPVCVTSNCVVQNTPGAVRLGGAWVDTGSYPAGGTKVDPLLDSDIQYEVKKAIHFNSWPIDANSIVFVITGVFASSGEIVEECKDSIPNCTFKGPSPFCGYHSYFSVSPVIIYSYLADASFFPFDGCSETINTPYNGLLSSDREVALMSHEFFEAVTDPQFNAYFASDGSEIGDNCNQIPGIMRVQSTTYLVQTQWNNKSSNCVDLLSDVVDLNPVYYLLNEEDAPATAEK